MRKGFTLVELLIVIVVISILISIAIPRIKGMRDEANNVKARAETRALMAAIESYYINRKPLSYPETTNTICAGVLNTLKPLIISEVLYDPFGATPTTEYKYIKSVNGDFYVIFSVGIDGQEDITGISDEGILQGVIDDDIFATNGTGFET